MNPYLLVFDESTVARGNFVDVIDNIQEIHNWMFFFNNGACIVSDLSAHQLTNLIREQIPQANFIIARLDQGKRGGWLRKSVWDFIRDPKPVSG